MPEAASKDGARPGPVRRADRALASVIVPACYGNERQLGNV